MFLDADQKTFNLQSDSSAFARAVKLVSLSSKRIINALLAAAHESKRAQAQRIVHEYRHLIDPAPGQQSVPRARAAIEKTDLARMSLRAETSHVNL